MLKVQTWHTDTPHTPYLGARIQMQTPTDKGHSLGIQPISRRTHNQGCSGPL